MRFPIPTFRTKAATGLTVLGCALLAALTATAAEVRQPLPDAHALVDVRVVTAPGEVLDGATLVIRNGIIEAVGDVDVPADAAIIEFERGEDQPPITVYPGLIDPYLVIAADDRDDAPDSPPGRHPLIRPDVTVAALDWPADAVEGHRRAGFTTALIAPGSGLLRGESVLANLGDGGLSGNRLRSGVAQHGHLHERSPDNGYPQSLMGSVALFRQTLLDADWQQRARSAWQNEPGQARPEWLPGLDALAPVLNGDRPLVMESRDTHDSLRILDLVDPSIDLVLIGHGAEYQRLDQYPRTVPHILTVDFPDAPDVDDLDDRDVSLEELRHWRRAPENPARLLEAGVPVLFTAHGLSGPTDLFARLATAIERGLEADQALAGLTTRPAEWLGIADRAGRIQTGYMANLVVVEGELFTEAPTISEVWIDGVRFELARLEPPAVDPVGTWALTLGLPGMGDVDAELVLTGTPSSLDGTLNTMGNETPLSEIRVSGKQLQIRIDASRFGGAGTISINMDIDGDRGRGNGSGPFGEFTVRGQRSSGPDEEETRS
ncbi:amidohydrolase family protein [Wenzhouxiangella sp. XN79A]|uniref:amidohydrolase family protein n=1 Tax=Wenzhouxiangella sp. XN79A TaxID=2724193 RepID=UPI00144ACB03|nr:amidohydrolase family protein [Wenzhouxiangella sp. XN79A]NKI35310.1 amidohydrolase family protein [Wenzhouxiangella sp. XN79A]